MNLELSKIAQDLHPEVLMSIKLPDDQYRIALRLFDSNRRIEVMTRARPSQTTTDRCWVIYFDDWKEALKLGKNMLRRLANITAEMPADWFTYRNFITKRISKQVEGTSDGVSPSEDLSPSTPFEVRIDGNHTWVRLLLLSLPK